MIKSSFLSLFLLLVISCCYTQDSALVEEYVWKPNRFCLSANPVGAVFFGPIVNAELLLGDRLRFNSHVRFPGAGFINYAKNTNNYKITGLAIGGGLIIDIQKKRGTPYAGLLMEYDQHTEYYSAYRDDELAGQSERSQYVLGLSIGYRWRFYNGFILNHGAHIFISKGIGNYSYHQQFDPLLSADISLGYEFGRR